MFDLFTYKWLNDYLKCCKIISKLHSCIHFSKHLFYLIELTSTLNLCRILLQLNLYKVNINKFIFHDKPNKAIEFQYNSKNEFNDLLLLLLHSENFLLHYLFILKPRHFLLNNSLTIHSTRRFQKCMFNLFQFLYVCL